MNKYDNDLVDEVKKALDNNPDKSFNDILNKASRLETRNKVEDFRQLSTKRLLNGVKKMNNKGENNDS